MKKAALVALSLIALGLLAAELVLPRYVTSREYAREHVVQQDLLSIRAVIIQYTLDKQKRPHALDDLVVAGYIKDVPTDPTTSRKDTWIVECSQDRASPGIVDIASAYGSTSHTGTFRCD
jgi:type II secretory pathway pseudopilin PulG